MILYLIGTLLCYVIIRLLAKNKSNNTWGVVIGTLFIAVITSWVGFLIGLLVYLISKHGDKKAPRWL